MELHSGDRMTQKEFHRIYQRMPAHFKAELIGGIVYVASPLKRRHGTTHKWINTLLGIYEGHTLGTESGENVTVLLGEEGEPQLDQYLRILPEYGGQSRDDPHDYVAGPPELIVEIAHSSLAIDLHAKRDDYKRYGVLEYLVVCLRDRQVRWFHLRDDQELQPDAAGIFRIRTFPGLWIHGDALFAHDFATMIAVLNQGLASPEHDDFVRLLAAARTNTSS